MLSVTGQAVDQEMVSYYRCPEIYGTCAIDPSVRPDINYPIVTASRVRGQSSDYVHSTLERSSCGTSRLEAETLSALPFSSSEIVQHLRCERYVAKQSGNGLGTIRRTLQRDVYYAVRPFLGVSVRKHLQRRSLRGWDQIPFPRWPVDRTVDNLFEQFLVLSMRAHGVDRIPFIWFWPDGHESCCIITHDVEEAAGMNACDAVMDLDSGVGIKASFQFVPEGRYRVSTQLLERVRGRGFEVNVHDLNHDGKLYHSRREFLRRADKINRYLVEYDARGFRSAVLYRNVSWYDAFRFAYDMSVPNVGHLDPQRGGCCTITPYFIGNIVELPLTTIQDYSLFHILGDYSLDIWKTQADFITQNHGLLSFNVHPDYLGTARARDTYRALLEHLARLGADGGTYFARPGEVERWWRARMQMSLISDGAQWRIEGLGSEHAIVAYAHLDGDHLSYSLQSSAETAGPQPDRPVPSSMGRKARPETSRP